MVGAVAVVVVVGTVVDAVIVVEVVRTDGVVEVALAGGGPVHRVPGTGFHVGW